MPAAALHAGTNSTALQNDSDNASDNLSDNPSDNAPYTVLIHGDSISAAYGMSLEQGWVALLEQTLAQEFPTLKMVNASISGETTEGGLRRLPSLLEEHKPSLVVIELGGNDGLRGYPIKTLRNNLRELVHLSTNAGAQVILLPMEIPPNYGSRYTKAFRNSYSVVAQETQSYLGKFILEEIALVDELMQDDGIHPTAQAQPQIAAAVEAAIRDIKESM